MVTIINPDLYLEVNGKRIWTPERSQRAWDTCFRALENACRSFSQSEGVVLLVCGVQGSGKSSWIRKNASSFAPCICFDAALPRAHHRQPIVEIARRFGVAIKAIYMDVPLEVALSRNAARAEDERVAEAAIRNVSRQFEVPNCLEGFDEVIRADGLA